MLNISRSKYGSINALIKSINAGLAWGFVNESDIE